jgi:2-polyprenyl-3-methyl-5-hydroxy-6-metoxy-1,4-benzoquinol methylase
MLKNDEIFWYPNESSNAVRLSWGGSAGDFEKLWDHSTKKWKHIVRTLRDAKLPSPRGKIVEFGPGMGLLDDLLDQTTSEILMLDHTSAYIQQRAAPLSARCRHVLFTEDNLVQLLQSEAESYDWLLSLSVFYHIDDATAVAIISELGKLLKPGGYALIYGWNDSTPEMLRERGTIERLFARYPQYFINWNLVQSSVAPDYRQVHRKGIVVYQKIQSQIYSTSKSQESSVTRLEQSGLTLRLGHVCRNLRHRFLSRFFTNSLLSIARAQKGTAPDPTSRDYRTRREASLCHENAQTTERIS